MSCCCGYWLSVLCQVWAEGKGKVSRGETKVAVEVGLRVASDVGLFSFCGHCGLLGCVDIGCLLFMVTVSIGSSSELLWAQG